MNINKIGLLTLAISLLTTLGLTSNKTYAVKAEGPEPIVLDLHQEYILDRVAMRLNDTHDDWENAITSWIYDPTEIMGIKFFNMDIDSHTFVVEDVNEVKNFVYIEYLFLNYHLDYVDLPNIELDSMYHEYKRGLDYVRGLLDSFISLGSDIASLFMFDYTAPLDNSNPDDIQKVTDLVTTAYNLYQSMTMSFIENFNVHEIDEAEFFTDTTGDVKEHYKALSDIFIADPQQREDEAYTFGPYLLRIYRLLRYTQWDEVAECPELITPLTPDEITEARDRYYELKELYEAEYGSWFDTTVDPTFIKNYLVNVDSYSKYSGLIPLFFFLDSISELEKNSNLSSGYIEFFSTNYGPLLYKILDIIEATSVNDVPNIGIMTTDVVADTISCIINFYDNCVFRMKDTNTLAKKLYDTKTIFNQMVSDIEYSGLTIEEAIPTIIDIVGANKEIRIALDDGEESIENTQISQSFNHYLVEFNAFKEEYKEDMIDSLSGQFMGTLGELSDEAAELLSTEIVNPDDLVEYRDKVYNIKEKYDELLLLLAQKVVGLELSEDNFNSVLVLGSIFLLNFTMQSDLLDEQYVLGLHQEVLDLILVSKTALDDIESAYVKDCANIGDYVTKVQAEITKLTNAKKTLIDEIIPKIDDSRFGADLTKVNDLLTRANALASSIETLRQAIETQIAKEQTDLAAFNERWNAILARYDVLSHTKITSIETYTSVLNGYADLGKDTEDLLNEVKEYMDDESFIELKEFNDLVVVLSTSFETIEYDATIQLKEYVNETYVKLSNKLQAIKTSLDTIKSKYSSDVANLETYSKETAECISKLNALLTEAKGYDDAFIYDACIADLIEEINSLLPEANALASSIETLRQAIATQIAKERTDLAAFNERWDVILARYDVLSHTKITSIETYTSVLNGYADLGIDTEDLLDEVKEYMKGDSFIELKEFNELVIALSTGFESIEYSGMIHLKEYVNEIYVSLSNKLQAIKTSLDTIKNKYPSDSTNLRAYYEETRDYITKLDALLIEAKGYDDAFIYDVCIADLMGEINVVYDDAVELSVLISKAMAESEINRLVMLSNSFDEDIAAMQNYKENGLNYDGNIKKCDELISEMNAAIQEIDDNMEILGDDPRLVSARAKLVSGIESINASKQAIQKDHTIMLTVAIVCPIIFVITAFLLLYFFGFKKRFLRREKKVQ